MKITILDEFRSKDNSQVLIKIKQIELPDNFFERLREEMEKLNEK